MPNGTPVETRSPGAGQSSIDCTVDYLVLEMVRYYAVGQDLVAAVHAVETMGFRIGFQLAERYFFCSDVRIEYHHAHP